MSSRCLQIIQILVIWSISSESSGKTFSESTIWLDNVKVMKSYIDSSTDPCSDFYQYACGNWSAVHSEINAGDVLGLMEVEINKQIRELLLHIDAQRESNGSALVKVKQFYQSCISSGDNSIGLFLENFEPFQNSHSFNFTEPLDWIDVIANLRLYGVHVFIEELVLPHWNDSTRNFIYIDKANFTSLPRSYYLDKSLSHFLALYKESIADIFKLADYNESNALTIAEEILDFEMQLAEIMSEEDLYSDDAEEVVLGYLCQWIPEINWVKYFSIVLGKEVDLYETVIVISPSYFQSLVVLVSKTQPNILWNYFKFRVLSSLDDFKEFSKDDCTNILRSKFGKALSELYVEKYYNTQDTDDVMSMIGELKSSFDKIIDDSLWLDEVTKHEAKHKLHSTLSSVPHSGNRKYLNKTDHYYRDLQIDPNNFYRSYWSIIKHGVHREHAKLLETNKRYDHDKNQAVANAYYLKTQNLIIIPAGILQEPVYSREYPISYNFAVLGTIIGHELTHGFDYSGKDYDAEGNIRTWWDEETTTKYNERMQCIIDQYNKYTENGLEHLTNGKNTISENIADNGGLRLAYQAYSKLGESEQSMDGLYNTNYQLFFLSYAQFFCSELDNSILKKIFSEHSIDKYRVIGALSNMEEFSKEYKCPLGSPMNPVVKCRVW